MALITEMARSRRDEMIEKIQLLQEEISLLEQKCAVSDTVAKKMLREAIMQLKQKSQRFSVIDLHIITHLPFGQINRIMEEFEKKRSDKRCNR